MLMKKKTSQIFKTVPASTAGLLEEHVVTKSVSSANDPEAEGLPKIMCTFNRFSQLPVNQTCGQREETWQRDPKCSPHHKKTNSYRSEHLSAERYSANVELPITITANMLQLIIFKIFSKEAFPFTCLPLNRVALLSHRASADQWKAGHVGESWFPPSYSQPPVGWPWCQPACKQVIKKEVRRL